MVPALAAAAAKTQPKHIDCCVWRKHRGNQNAEWAFLTMLKEEGRRTIGKFLKHHVNDLGKRSTLNLDVLLQQV
jgi:NTE family protein